MCGLFNDSYFLNVLLNSTVTLEGFSERFCLLPQVVFSIGFQYLMTHVYLFVHLLFTVNSYPQ